MDRFLFAEAADNAEFMELLLTVIFGEEVLLRYPQQQNPYNLPKRSRYYQGLLDSKLLEPGDISYNQLNDVYTIVIMSFDLFRQGLYRYTFRMTCEEIPGLQLKDGAVRMFLNTKGTKEEGVSPELIELLHYFGETTNALAKRSGSPRIRRMQEIVNSIKADENVGVKYVQAWEEKKLERQQGQREGRKEGLREGLEKGRFETLRDLIEDGTLSLEAAADRSRGKREEFLKWYQARKC